MEYKGQAFSNEVLLQDFPWEELYFPLFRDACAHHSDLDRNTASDRVTVRRIPKLLHCSTCGAKAGAILIVHMGRVSSGMVGGYAIEVHLCVFASKNFGSPPAASAQRWPTDSTVAGTVKPLAAFHTILMLFALAVGATLVLRAGPVEARPPPPRGMDIAPEPTPGRFFQVRNENGYRSVVSIARKAGVNWRWIERSEWNRDRYFNPNISDNLRPNGGLSLSPKFASHGS